MPLWIPLTLTASFFWAISLNLIKKGLINISPLWNNIFSNLTKLIIWVPTVLLLSKFQIASLNLTKMLLIFIINCCYVLLYYALQKGKLALTSTVAGTAPIFTIILALIFLNETLSTLQILGIVFIIVGSLLIASPNKISRNKLQTISWFWWGLAVALLTGIGDFLTKISTNQIGAYSHLFYSSLILQFISILNYLVDNKGRKLPQFSKQKFLPTIIGTIVLWTGSLFYFLAFDYGPASLIVSLSAIYPALTVIIALIFLKEKITKKQIAGIGVICSGLLLVSF